MTRILTIMAVLLALLLSVPAQAAVMESDRQTVRIPESVSAWQMVQRQITAREARAIALARVPGGEVVDIRKTSDAYRVRIIARDGRVVDIVVDATTGRVR